MGQVRILSQAQMFNLKKEAKMSRKKSNEELGYVIPVMRRLEPGKYTYGYARSLEPDSRGQIKVRTPNLKLTSWLGTSVIHVPKGFKSKAQNQWIVDNVLPTII